MDDDVLFRWVMPLAIVTLGWIVGTLVQEALDNDENVKGKTK